MERRGRQHSDLITDTPPVHSDGSPEHTCRGSSYERWQNRWIRIGLKAQDRHTVFSNLHHHINVDSLREAFNALDGTKALGVDGISKSDYGRDLEDNLTALAMRIQRGTYRPQPKREVLIPKANGKTRPIAIACFEDKLVDWVVGKLLSAVYEPLFISNSFGYRPNKSAHDAIKACYKALCTNKRQHVVEIDFSNFFNTIPHRQLMTLLGQRISDRRFKGLIGRFLQGGLIQAGQASLPSQLGTPQGSIMSPVLANIYLNEVIDQWFKRHYASAPNIMVRYADDAVFFFHQANVAQEFKQALESRVIQYGLSLNTEKTRAITLTKKNHAHFHFLSFTFYWGKQASRTTLKVKTQKLALHKSMREFERWIKKNRSRFKLKILWATAKAKIQGHVNYFGYWMNKMKLRHFYEQAIKSLFRWLNKRSQKLSYTRKGFKQRLKHFPLVKPFERVALRKLGWNPYD